MGTPAHDFSRNKVLSKELLHVRILVVDDYEPFRHVVCESLGARPGWRVVGEACDGLEAVQMAEELKPDLIVLDIGMPGLNGIDAAKRISTLVPGTTILFLTQQSDPDVVAAALTNGAKGFLLKTNAGQELLPAVEAALEGKRFVGSGIIQCSPDVISPE